MNDAAVVPQARTFTDGSERFFAPRLRQVVEMRSDPKAFARKHWNDVAGWAREAIDWQGEEPNFAPYQVESWRSLLEPEPGFDARVCVRGPRGSGKSFSQVMQLLHFATTRYGAGVEWKIVTVAGSLGQLRRYLWPEVHKWIARLRWDRLGFEWRHGKEIGRMQLVGLGGSCAVAAAPQNEMLIEGAHAKEVAFFFDEAKAIPTRTWNACNGAFFNVGRRGNKGYWRADSTPGGPSGRFYDIHRRKKGLERWWTRHITLQEALGAEMITPETVQEMSDLWGPESRLFRNHVLAEFSTTADGRVVMPLDWVEAAIERGYEWLEDCVPQDNIPEDLRIGGTGTLTRTDRIRAWWELAAPFLPRLSQLGLDIGGGGPGRDPAALAMRHENIITPIEVIEGSVGTLIQRVAERYRQGAVVVPDVINAATVARQLERTMRVTDCNSSLPSSLRDRTGKLELLNVRTELWWGGRERLDTTQNPTLILPDDVTLVGELTEPEWEETPGGKIKVEDKKQIAKRVRRQVGREDEGGSTNRADAALMSLWTGATGSGSQAKVIKTREREGMSV